MNNELSVQSVEATVTRIFVQFFRFIHVKWMSWPMRAYMNTAYQAVTFIQPDCYSWFDQEIFN